MKTNRISLAQRASLVSLLLLCALLLALLPPVAQAQTVAPDGFADPAFRQIWTRADALVAAGSAGRSWVWGELPGSRRYERFDQAPGGVRLVQYVDKARMEINDPAGDRTSPWFVTGGLLVVEMIVGRLQVGATTFVNREAAAIPVAGDPVGNPDAPTYAMLAPLAALDGGNRVPSRVGQRVSATFGPAGMGENPAFARPETTIVRYEPVTGRNVPMVFQQFMEQRGPVLVNGRVVREQVVDPLFVFGYPITEPYWATVTVAGQQVPVLFQAFERRLLTYNPANPDPWKVEMGNVGQHYLGWRHGHTLHYARPVPAEPLAVRETTLTIPTYDLAPALRPTQPGDAIYPYDRLEPALVGPPQPREYRALVVENRFLTLTFLPELGGRLVQAVDRTTGRRIFYQNQVIKPSPFGQRGWWLGVGGLEWAVPTEEHGYLENLPWAMQVIREGDRVDVIATTTERQRGFEVLGTVTLRADEARFAVRLEARNPTTTAQPLQMWTNAILSPAGDNQVGPGMRFIVPTDELIVHATFDQALPAPRQRFPWPYQAGRDLRNPTNWTGYIGAFTPTPVSFIGAYDVEAEYGAVVSHGEGTVGGKIFGFGPSVEPGLYTDDGSAYVEVWSGAQPTFWDDPLLAPGASRAIATTWQPVWQMGLPATASPEGTVGLERRDDGGLTVTLATPQRLANATVVVSLDEREVFRSAPIELRPDLPFVIELPPGSTGVVGVAAAGRFWQAREVP
ncbi:DUF5107 domain-containing protein [Candidatus Chloroploca asiatica]|uniref:DUF5107 domain-containing protein n=1 Tax=Candidatus Chloroploca asiatica TaxID=1506545 RepID=A0A2H3KNB8_9CHLR|nr:DUF5107 domain-containing protein [Candidatus Chloroploca asiatica]PDV99676.1 DUF5107 domain-containing protein [Candidatus Chloroploca asiatica]